MKHVVVIGHTGLLGGWVVEELSTTYRLSLVSSRSKNHFAVDMSNSAAATKFLNEQHPDVILNLAALADVESCQSQIQRAYELNVLINKNIAEYLSHHPQSFCVSISTDHLYNNEVENDEEKIELKNIYALTKKLGEDVLPVAQSVVLRTNFFGRSQGGKNSFTDWLYQSFSNGNFIELYEDSFFSPLHGKTLARMIKLVIEKPKFGVFNLGSREGMSKAEFAENFKSLFKFEKANYRRVKYAESGNAKTPRPRYMKMNVQKFEAAYEVTLPTLAAQIALCKNEY